MKKYTALRQEPRINLLKSVPLPAPMSLYIEPTNICNFKCSFCPESFSNYEDLVGGTFQLTLENMHKIKDQILDITNGAGVSTINFYMMGEPLVNKFTPEFIKIAKDNNLAKKIILTTNGSLLKGEKAKNLSLNPPDYLRISIYGSNQHQHQRITQSRVDLLTIRENISDFMNLSKPYPCLVYVKMIDQGEELNTQFKNLFESVADEIEIEPVMNWNDPKEGNLSGTSSEQLLQSDFFKNKKNVCPSPFYVLVIHSDLNVSVCCVDWSKQTQIGNLNRTSLRDIWDGQELHEFQIKHLEGNRALIPACAKCTFLHTYPDNLDNLSADNYKKRIMKK